MLKKLAPVFMVLFLALALAPAANAQHGQHGRWWSRPQVVEKISLSDAEKAKLDAAYAESEIRRVDLKAAVAKERLALSTVMEDPAAGEKQIMARYDALRKAQNELSADRFRFLMEVRRIIGAERFRTLTGMFEEFRNNREARWNQEAQERQGRPGTPPGAAATK